MRFVLCALVVAFSSCGQPVSDIEFPASIDLPQADIQMIHKDFGQSVPRKVKPPISEQVAASFERDAVASFGGLSSTAMRTDEAIERMVTFSAWLLQRRGLNYEADMIVREYYGRFDGFMVRQESIRGLGDHAPLISWLADWYAVLESRLGPRVLRFTNLEHIKILNYAIPVVFNPRGKDGDSWDMYEYRDHFAGTRERFFYPLWQHNGLAGVVTYWAVWGACTAGTSGTGGILPWVCATVADVSCFRVGRDIAPGMSDRIYRRANGL